MQRNIVVIGGSYVGVNVAQQLAARFAGTPRVILIEKNSHFQHLFAFPRFATTGDVNTHKAFIPYVPGTFAACPPSSGTVIQARVTGLTKTSIQLDKKVSLDGQDLDSIPYSFLVIATGTKLSAPSTLPDTEKHNGVAYLRSHVDQLAKSSEIVVIGGGAVGVQFATDIKEIYPEKSVTLVHSRKQLMNFFHPGLHEIVESRCKELGVQLKLGSRVRLPSQGYPTDGSLFNVEFMDGSTIPANFAIICTGQSPQSGVLRQLSPDSINESGFIKVLDTLQMADTECPNIFAIGDVAATGAQKAAKPAGKQAALVVENIDHLLKETPLEKYVITDPSAIHLSLGVTKNLIFRNPIPGANEPFIKHRDDGTLDMNIDGVWTRRGGGRDAML